MVTSGAWALAVVAWEEAVSAAEEEEEIWAVETWTTAAAAMEEAAVDMEMVEVEVSDKVITTGV